MSYRRYFFKCLDCGYMLTSLSQVNKEIYVCPSCESSDIDYAPSTDRKEFAKDLFAELKYMFDTEGNDY